MDVPESTRRQVSDCLTQAEFSLKVAQNFACLKGTPAHDAVRAALGQIEAARAWVAQNVQAERSTKVNAFPPIGTGLPLTRKERFGYRWP